MRQAGAWKSAQAYAVRPPSAASEDLRVYLEGSVRGSYSNLVMIRDAKGYGTTPLFPPETLGLRAVPGR